MYSSNPAVTAPLARILLIDDDDSVRRITARLLRLCGYVVSDWPSPREALANLASTGEPIDLLLTDTAMPDISGAQAADRVQAERPGIPVVFMSGYAVDAVNEALCAGPRRSFIAKPFRSDELAARIASALLPDQPVG